MGSLFRKTRKHDVVRGCFLGAQVLNGPFHCGATLRRTDRTGGGAARRECWEIGAMRCFKQS